MKFAEFINRFLDVQAGPHVKMRSDFVPTRRSKHRPLQVGGIGEPDPKGADRYLFRKNLHPGRASSLKKLRRADGIRRGLRPETCHVMNSEERRG